MSAAGLASEQRQRLVKAALARKKKRAAKIGNFGEFFGSGRTLAGPRLQVRERALRLGFEYLSTLIEERLRDTGPSWLREAALLQSIENYLRSGIRFAYLQASLTETAAGPGASAQAT